jgi:hypothetical protein
VVRAESVFLPVFALVALLGSPARAEPLPALVVTRAPGANDCPDAASLAAEVARMNGRPSLDPSGNSVATTRLHVELTRGLEGYAAVIRAAGERSGERRLTDVGPTCENLADALALTLALILDSDRGSIDSSGPAPHFSRAPHAFEPRLDGRTFAAPAMKSRNSLDLAAGVGVHAEALDEAGILFTGLVRLSLGEWLLLEAGGFVTGQQTVPHEGSEGSLALRLASGFLGVCARLASDRSPLALALCAEPYVGWLRGEGSGFEVERPAQTHLWLAGGLTLDADGAISGRLRWYGRVGGLLVARRGFFVSVDGQRESPLLFETSGAAVLASAGLRLHFE